MKFLVECRTLKFVRGFVDAGVLLMLGYCNKTRNFVQNLSTCSFYAIPYIQDDLNFGLMPELFSFYDAKLSVLAGDFPRSRACVALASLRNTKVVSLLAKVVEHLVTGETMQMTSTSEERCRYVMELCEKSLVNVLERRGAGYFEEKQVLTIFRDVCNAVFAMHCQSPPVAQRDLKAENILLGADGSWKLCDFGSISTNHNRFERPEEMGIEKDNIRKYTTPAYRARREVISEKVDIWALGCLLYRICYFKYAFDGESKLQILNGNYRIPSLPKYSAAILDLIRDVLQASSDDRPDITQARALLDWPFISMNLG
ncbi:hypothetical protein Syun_026469 [Stephania yunnanensis]|uniref:non-specific serine/threonine protein kinase n=1 Tax=Stephania yunnanensis TaxID=152371 RepID=A0AAP0EU13_9MAGN